jgi:hypothetical protein
MNHLLKRMTNFLAINIIYAKEKTGIQKSTVVVVSELNKGNTRLSSHPPQSSQSFSCTKKSKQF